MIQVWALASNNPNKAKEISQLLGDDVQLKTLKELNADAELLRKFEEVETADTLEGNAFLKAKLIHDTFEIPAIADDTGLEVEALDGAPGVLSARYAGADKSAEANSQLLLKNLADKENRKARFRTVLCFYDGSAQFFEGISKGKILKSPVGKKGFGYDPIFQPEGYDISFAQMSADEKNKISHRGRAIAFFVKNFLKK